MDLVLINPNPGGHGLNESTVLPPLGLAYIASFVEKYKYNVKIIDSNLLQKIIQIVFTKTILFSARVRPIIRHA